MSISIRTTPGVERLPEYQGGRPSLDPSSLVRRLQAVAYRFATGVESNDTSSPACQTCGVRDPLTYLVEQRWTCSGCRRELQPPRRAARAA